MQKVVVGHEMELRPVGSRLLPEPVHEVPSHFTTLPLPAAAKHRLDEAHDTALIWPSPGEAAIAGTPFQVVTFPL
jgi:hypothetical protein